MAEFSALEIQNELSRYLRGAITLEQQGGQNDPEALHAQVIEVARVVFLLNPGAIFYLAQIVRNRLQAVLNDEISIVEDMLGALDDVRRIRSTKLGEVGPTDLRNASTTIFNLELATNISGRPELERFQRQIDNFNAVLRPAIVDDSSSFRFQTAEAREIVRANFIQLQSLHSSFLSLLSNLTTLVDIYIALDMPSLVSQNSLSNIRTDLTALADSIDQQSSVENDRNSRGYYLRATAAKVVVQLLANFRNPDFQSPALTSQGTGFAARGIVGSTNNDLGRGPPFRLRGTGSGTPATIVTSPGPWLLDDLSQSSLSISVDGGAAQIVDLSEVQGPGIHGTVEGPWPDSIIHPAWPGPGAATDEPPPAQEDYSPRNELHIVVDPDTYVFTSERWGYQEIDGTTQMEGIDTAAGVAPAPREGNDPANVPDSPPVDGGGNLVSDYWTTVRMQPPVKLGFKHLGCGVFFTLPAVEASSSADAIVGAGFASWTVNGQDQRDNPEAWQNIQGTRWPYVLQPRVIRELALLESVAVTISGDVVTRASGSFQPSYVGYYIRTGTFPTEERYEIIEYISPTQIRVDFRGDAVANGTVLVFGSRGDYTEVTFDPDLLRNTRDVADTEPGSLGPHNVRDTVTVTIAPAVKTASVPSGLPGGGTIGEVVTALSNPVNGSNTGNKYAHASFHVVFKEQAGFANKLTIQGRSRLKPEGLGIVDQYFLHQPTIPAVTPDVINSGTVARIVTSGPKTLFMADVTGVDISSLGRSLVITGAFTINNGTYEIVDFARLAPVDPNVDTGAGSPISGAPVIYNPSGVAPDGNNGAIDWDLVRTEEAFPPPADQIVVNNSVSKVFGFQAAQVADTQSSVYLSVEELQSLVNLTGADSEIEEVDIVEGALRTVANSFTVTDQGGVDFDAVGVQLGFLLEIQEGPDSGLYIVSSGTGSTLTLTFPAGKNARGFETNSAVYPYRLFAQRLRISSQNTERGSSLLVNSAPTQFGLPTTIQYGTLPSVEAVNDGGQKLDFSGLSVGDRINGSLAITVVAEDGGSVDIDGGVSSEDVSTTFTATSSVEDALDGVISNLTTILNSGNLLAKNGFNQSLDRLDAALSPVLASGAALQSNVNTVATLLAELHSVLTSTPRRTDFSTELPVASLNVEDSISGYSAPRVVSLDALLNALQDKGYDRALSLLTEGDIATFFGTSSETASFAGNFLASARAVFRDLPDQSQLSSRVDEVIQNADGFVQLTDPDSDFSDTDSSRSNDLV